MFPADADDRFAGDLASGACTAHFSAER